MIKVGITGQAGFVGTHLYNELGLHSDEFERIPFKDDFFQSEDSLRSFVKGCDVVVHLAAVNRSSDENELYRINIELVTKLISALKAEEVTPHILFSSSTQEDRGNMYGDSKIKGRELLETWAKENKASFTGLVVPNVYGPFGRPNYNSFVATFCEKLTHNENPEVLQDSPVNLIYVGSLCQLIINKIRENNKVEINKVERCLLPHDVTKKVTEILSLFQNFKSLYFDNGIIPTLADINDLNLFNTFRSYIDIDKHFPVKLIKHTDERGSFVETVKLGVGGQVSFSTTVPNITRGNHYHSRKIERFTVIKGKALIQLRKIGTSEIHEFILDGEEPSYVDMPIWYTHNITNIGKDELYTQFWINEWYNPKDGDTYFEKV